MHCAKPKRIQLTGQPRILCDPLLDPASRGHLESACRREDSCGVGPRGLTAMVAPFLPAPPVNILSTVPPGLNMDIRPQTAPTQVINWLGVRNIS